MPQDSVTLLYEVGLLIVVSSLASEAFKRIRLPGIVGAIIVGVVIGGSGGLGLVTDLTVINVLAVLGGLLILFMTGLEFEASAFWGAGRRAFVLTTVGAVASVFTGFTIGLSLGWSALAALLLGVVLAPSGTSIVAVTLSSENKVNTNGGLTLLTACVVDDVEGVILLSIVLGLFERKSFSIMDAAWATLAALLFIMGSIYIGGRLFPMLLSRFGSAMSDEVLFPTLLGMGLMLAFAASQVGLAAITGAFIMGAIIPYRKFGERLAHRLLMMKEIFAAVFFTGIGLTISPSYVLKVLPLAFFILVLALAARIAGGLIGGFMGGLRGKILFAVSVGLAIRAEMSLIIAREGVAAGIVDDEFLALAATTVMGSMIMALPVFSRLVRSIQ